MKNRRILTALALAFLISAGCTYLLSRRIAGVGSSNRAPDKQYAAASRAVQAGERLKADNMEMIAWPADDPIHGASLRAADLNGRVVLSPLEKGEPILERELAAPGSGVGLAGKIPDGMRAIALRSDEVVGVAGFLIPGSHLDVLATYRTNTSPEPVTLTVLQDVIVLAAGQQVEPDPAGKPAAVTVVTLLLKPEEAERAFLASNQGTIHFVLRNGADKGRTTQQPVFLAELSGMARVQNAGGRNPGTGAAPKPAKSPRSANLTREMGIETVLGDSKQDGGRKE